MHDSMQRGKIQYDPYTPEQQYEVQKVAQNFLEGEIDDVDELNSMRQIKELFNQMRNVYKKLEYDAKNIQIRGETMREGKPLPQ